MIELAIQDQKKIIKSVDEKFHTISPDTDLTEHPFYEIYHNAVDEAFAYDITPTIYFLEAMAYHERAEFLQHKNLGLIKSSEQSGCDLQDNVHIYDTVNRWYAGFSNAIQEIYLGPENPKRKWNIKHGISKPNTPSYKDKFNPVEWLYLFLIHRVCGSGASFALPGNKKLPPHGWYNTPVPFLATHCDNKEQIQNAIKDFEGPIFSSIGNQIPPFNKPNPPYTQGGREYLVEIAPKLAEHIYGWVVGFDHNKSIQETVDEALRFQSEELGCKRFKFVITAWVMDIAEYFPSYVDPDSNCYHGKNAIEAMNLVFKNTYKLKKQDFYDLGTRFFADWFGTRPMDVEDASPGCDLVRYLENYINPKSYENVCRETVFNSIFVKHPHGRQPWK